MSLSGEVAALASRLATEFNAVRAAVAQKSRLTVDGSFVGTYDIDTTPVSYSDIAGTVQQAAEICVYLVFISRL